MTENENKITPIKDIQYSYSSFLWHDFTVVRELQKQGDHYAALWYLLDTIDWLPEDFQNKMEFQEKAQKIRNQLNQIKSYRILAYQQKLDNNEQKNRISYGILKTLIPELAVKLDQKGYMERKGGVTTVTKSLKDFQMNVDRARYESEH